MSEDFKQWWIKNKEQYKCVKDAYIAYDAWSAATEAMQAKLDANDKELEALRGFAGDVLYVFSKKELSAKMLINIAKELKLIDADGKPTPLLTGKKE
jgi:hypothetical protein